MVILPSVFDLGQQKSQCTGRLSSNRTVAEVDCHPIRKAYEVVIAHAGCVLFN